MNTTEELKKIKSAMLELPIILFIGIFLMWVIRYALGTFNDTDLKIGMGVIIGMLWMFLYVWSAINVIEKKCKEEDDEEWL